MYYNTIMVNLFSLSGDRLGYWKNLCMIYEVLVSISWTG